MRQKKDIKKQKIGKKDVVLLIEDEQDTADLIRLHIEKSGMAVVHASDGRQAACLIDTIMPPRAILLDLVVPYLNGFELIKIIRAKTEWKQIPVMVVSSNSYPVDIKHMQCEGATDYIVKSWGIGVLHHRLKQMLEQTANKSAAKKAGPLGANS